jgi:hypothetical protein
MATEYWFNTVTGEVEEGRVSDWSVVLGPYPTREAAARALETAHRRSAAWDEADRAWQGGGDGPRDARVDDERSSAAAGGTSRSSDADGDETAGGDGPTGGDTSGG